MMNERASLDNVHVPNGVDVLQKVMCAQTKSQTTVWRRVEIQTITEEVVWIIWDHDIVATIRRIVTKRSED